jgi:hypothetical protein
LPRRFESSQARVSALAASSPLGTPLGTPITMTPSELLVTQIKCCTTEAEVLVLVEEHHLSGTFTAVHAAAALHHAACLSTSMSMRAKVFKKLVAVARPYIKEMKPRQLANSVWALAKLGHTDAGFMDEALQAAKPQLHSFDTQEVAMMRRAMITLGHVDTVFMHEYVATPFSFDPWNL